MNIFVFDCVPNRMLSYFIFTPVILILSDIIELPANIIESIDRENVIAVDGDGNKQLIVDCNT